MSLYIEQDTIDGAWVGALDVVRDQHKGTATHLFVAIATPQTGTKPAVATLVDTALRGRRQQPVGTVASTIFPSALYDAPAHAWSPDLPAAPVAELDEAARRLYSTYLEMLPDLRRYPGNSHGTYFSRMISWTGKTAGGANQLEKRIAFLRNERKQGRGTSNFSEIAIAGEADGANSSDGSLEVLLEEFSVADTQTQGFPCLVHIDVSVREGALSLMAIYRHWHLITRGYGNLVGLARLQAFLCQQTGFSPGELAIAAGHANAEFDRYGRQSVAALVAAAGDALEPHGEPVVARR